VARRVAATGHHDDLPKAVTLKRFGFHPGVIQSGQQVSMAQCNNSPGQIRDEVN